MSNILNRKELLKAIFSHGQVRKKIFRIAIDDKEGATVVGHIVRVGDVVLTLIPYENNKFVVCKNSL